MANSDEYVGDEYVGDAPLDEARMTDAQLRERLRFKLDKVRSQQDPIPGREGHKPLTFGTPPSPGSRPDTSGGGYRFALDGLNQIIKECEELRDDLARDSQHYAKLAGVQPPAPDEHASGLHARAVNRFGENQLRRNRIWLRFLHDYIGRLREARKAYLSQEQHAADEARGNSGET